MFLNETGKAILELCDGTRSADEISLLLGARYGADVHDDVTEFLATMVRRDLVILPAEGGAAAEDAHA